MVAVDSVGLGQHLRSVLPDMQSNTGVCDIVSWASAMNQVGEIVRPVQYEYLSTAVTTAFTNTCQLIYSGASPVEVSNLPVRFDFVMRPQNWTLDFMVGPIPAQVRFNLGRAKWTGGEMVYKGKTCASCGKR